MIFPIEPYVGVGAIKLGMSRDEVRGVLNAKFQTFSKGGSSSLTDSFDSLGIHVYYDDDKCEAVELFSPAAPIYQAQQFIAKPYNHIRDWFEKRDSKTEIEPAGLTSPQLGISVYAPFAGKHPTEPVESVMVFEKGYYEKA